jgi:hypothetical protein
MAYQLNQKSGRETVLRGGFGVYYDLGSGEAALGFINFFPFRAIRNQSGVPYPIPSDQAQPPSFAGIQLPIRGSVVALDPSLQLPFTLEWNFSVEQSLGQKQAISLSYVASTARRQLRSQQLNNPARGSGPRPNANFRNIDFVSNGPTSDYQSFQAQFQRRLSRGVQALLNYTWSHAIDQVSDEVASDSGVLDRGSADFDVRHNFSAALTYNVPKIKAGSIIATLASDWSFNSTVYAQSGLPTNIGAGLLIRSDGTLATVRPDLVLGQPLWVHDPIAPGGKRINLAAFQAPPVDPDTGLSARQGTLGRNVVRLPARYQVNMALRRSFPITEKLALGLSAEVFNVFNQPLFGQYDTNYAPDSTSFGLAMSTLNRSIGGLNSLYQIGGPRSIQLSLRLSF